MQSKEKRHFNITLSEEDIVSFDTNIANSGVLVKVLAAANATAIDIIQRETGDNNIANILLYETLLALNEIKEKRGETIEDSK